MILSHRAPSCFNMSSYRAIWTNFRTISIISEQIKIPKSCIWAITSRSISWLHDSIFTGTVFTLINFFGLNLKNIKQKSEKILSVIIGFFSGILGGLSTFYAPPIITFLVSLNLDKESFIRTTATMYFLASIPLYSSLIYHGLGNFYDLLISLVVTPLALLGQYFGTKIRMRLSNEIFRKTILSILIIIGFSLLIKN